MSKNMDCDSDTDAAHRRECRREEEDNRKENPTMRKLIEQFAKFGAVGITATIIDYAVLMLLSQAFGMDPVVAAGISFCVSLVFNYVASMRYVFSHREDMSKQKEFMVFLVLSAIGFALNELIMDFGVRAFGDSAFMVTVVKLCATSIVMVWNFLSRKKWLDAGTTDDGGPEKATVAG